ncbi:MAG: hypothetical protein WBX26_05585 [Candidatus Cybelea sp.]
MRFVLLAIAITFAGCSVPAGQSPAPFVQSSRSQAQAQLFSFLHRMKRAPSRRDRRASWMAPAAKSQTLLYVSDGGADEVLIYSYHAGKMVGKLTHLQDPAGVCSDPTGNVWVVNSASLTILQYAHGATKSKATLDDSGSANPLGCSVDPRTGDLAVTNLGTASGGGNLAIYTAAQGSATTYTDPDLMYVYFCGYDDRGNLFVDGLDGTYQFVLAELPSGGETLQTIGLSGSVGFPGGVAWDGKYIAIGDQYYQNKHTAAIFQYSVSGSAGTLVGTTVLSATCDALQFAIPKDGQQRTTVVVPDACLNSAAFYDYPAGGSPSITFSGFEYPVAAAVSFPK